MIKKYIKLAYLLPLAFAAVSCDDYLDEMPDNRAEVDTSEKIEKLLVSAYPENSYILCTELASDNVDDYSASNPEYERIHEELYNWKEVSEDDNESPKSVWSALYGAIANANQALQAINDLGNPESTLASRGEALLCRAYAHFLLVNMFSQAYSAQHSTSDLGIPFMTAPEIELNPKYERGTVAEVYELIDKDLQEGLPLINDAIYDVPKYHFNQKAAYTFAARFYLFYQKWDKAIEYASKALGSAPQELLRDVSYIASLPANGQVRPEAYNSSSLKCNFLLQTGYSALGLVFGPYYVCSRYNHGNMIANMETFNFAPWGSYDTSTYNYRRMYKLYPNIYAGTNLDKTLVMSSPYLFEYTDPVAGIGYYRTVYCPLTAEEALITRAEAYVMKEMYTEALADINTWTSNVLNTNYIDNNLTDEEIQAWAKNLPYHQFDAPSPKKHLNPDFMTIEEGSKQESYIHAVLYIRRQELLHKGMRFFDIKRWGIEIARRTVDGLNVVSVDDTLKVRDNRCAMQLPSDVIAAGMTPNPR